MSNVGVFGWAERVDKGADVAWLAAFHAGDAAVLEECYREQCPNVLRATSHVLPRADAETVTHETFYRVMSDDRMRKSFTGGNFGGWLKQVAVNAAIDHVRRYRREAPHDDETSTQGETSSRMDEGVEAKVLVDRFRREALPPSWEGVFEVRFLQQLSQREAAESLGMQRTTLVYQEQKIRELLRKFVLEERRS